MAGYSAAIISFLLTMVLAETTHAQQPSSTWIEGNYVSAYSNQGRQRYITEGTLSPGGPTLTAHGYPRMSWGNGFDVGAGHTFWAGLGIGARWMWVRYDYTIHVDYLVRFTFGFDSTQSDDVHRTDQALDLMATYTVPFPSPAIHVSVFAVPTFFRVA